MKKHIKVLSVFLFMFLFACQVGFSASASSVTVPDNSPAVYSDEGTIQPRADVILRKYRLYNGVLQYRDWNETWAKWVQPYWTNAK